MSTGKPLITIVLGTRPEAIKLAPVIQAFQAAPNFDTRVVLTGQHREVVSQVMDFFGLMADQCLALMAPKQTLTHITCAALNGLKQEFEAHRPALVLVQGDTSTAFGCVLRADSGGSCRGRAAHRRSVRSISRRSQPAHDPAADSAALYPRGPSWQRPTRASGVVGEVVVTCTR